MTSSVAIIMRAMNEMPYTRSALDMLKQQTVSNFDIFAVDSGSTDGTLETLQAHSVSLQQIRPEDYVPGKVLNEAIARTHHEIIVLLNADAIPQSTDWLEKLIQPIINDETDATFSKQIPRSDAHFIVSYDYERAYNPGEIAPEFFSAVSCAFKRAIWEAHNFPNHDYAEDTIWASACLIYGARFQFVPESEVEHSHNYTRQQLFDKKYRHGYALGTTQGKTSPLSHRLYLCGRELLRDFIYACKKKQFRIIPNNIAYRIIIHTGFHAGIRNAAK
ncbi:MAG: glycosyltransferase family 2 protein [Pontiella sp.]